MRISLIVFFALLACVDPVVANSTPTLALSVSAVGGHSDKRMLRAEVADTTPDDEERILGLNRLKSWNTNRQVKKAVKKIAPKAIKDEDKALHQATVKFANEAVAKAKADAKEAETIAFLIGKKADPAAIKKAGASDGLVEKYTAALGTAQAKAKAEVEAAKAAAAAKAG